MSKYKKFTYSICKHDGKYKSHGKISDENCRKKCDSNEGLKKEKCIAYATKKYDWCTTYSKCEKKNHSESEPWGGKFYDKVEKKIASGKACINSSDCESGLCLGKKCCKKYVKHVQPNCNSCNNSGWCSSCKNSKLFKYGKYENPDPNNNSQEWNCHLKNQKMTLKDAGKLSGLWIGVATNYGKSKSKKNAYKYWNKINDTQFNLYTAENYCKNYYMYASWSKEKDVNIYMINQEN